MKISNFIFFAKCMNIINNLTRISFEARRFLHGYTHEFSMNSWRVRPIARDGFRGDSTNCGNDTSSMRSNLGCHNGRLNMQVTSSVIQSKEHILR